MRTRWGRTVALSLVVLSGGCGGGELVPPSSSEGTVAVPTSRSTSTSSSPSPSTSVPESAAGVRDIEPLIRFSPLEPGTYSIDHDHDHSTSLRVLYTIPAEGWLGWVGAIKNEDGPESKNRLVGVSITSVDNLVVDACSDHRAADPPLGPTVDDLATGLANLPGLTVTAPPTDVNINGYSGQHLELAVPDTEVDRAGEFTDCLRGDLMSWMAPRLTYARFYQGAQQIEEFWILDIEGTRLMIQATWFPNSPPEDVAEMRAILDSIRIEP